LYVSEPDLNLNPLLLTRV